jgi:hypothetical protein
MDHDDRKENWSRTTNHYPGCSCPPFRYSPAHMHKRLTNPDCQIHGETKTR